MVKRVIMAVGAAVILAVLSIVLWHSYRVPLLTSSEQLRIFLGKHRQWAPFLLIILQALQVILAPIPGQALGLVSGYLFGPIMGTAYSMIGLLLGSLAAIGLARLFGRPLVERLVPSEALAQVDRFAEEGGIWLLLLIFLLPFLPDDAACFLAGLSPLPISYLIIVTAIGRLPGALVAALAGAGLSRLAPLQVLILVLALVPALVLLMLHKGALQAYFHTLVRRALQGFNKAP